MKFLRNILTVLLVLATIAVGVLFALQNKMPVPLDLLVYTFEPQSLALWILAAFAVGGILGLLISSAILVRLRASLASTRRQLAKARTEADLLRNAESVVNAK
ncbi:MAG: LapA family protein [Halioglobus sp.]